ncbi:MULTISPECIES: hypothetical protein [unclassified Modestobacter]
MVSVWVQSVHNLHCPRCNSRLVEQAGRFAVAERPSPVYVGEVGTLQCPEGHVLPPRDVLYAHREQRGLPRAAPVAEVDAPSAERPLTTVER